MMAGVMGEREAAVEGGADPVQATSDSERPSWFAGGGGGVRQAIAVLTLVGAAAWLCLMLTHHLGRITPIWVANAIWLAFLLESPRRRWPLLVLAGFTGDVIANKFAHDSWAVALGFGVANTLEVTICAVGMMAVLAGRFDIRRPKDLMVFCVAAAVCSSLSAFVAAAVMFFQTGAAMAPNMLVWGLGDVLGLLIFVPPLTVAARGDLAALFRPAAAQRTAAVISVGALSLIASAVLPQHPIMVMTPPVLILAALQLEFAGAALAVLVMSTASVVFICVGWVPMALAARTDLEQAFWLQAFLLVAALMTFPIAAVLASRRELEGKLFHAGEIAREAMRQAQLAEELASIGYWRYDYATGVLTWSEEMFRIYGRKLADGQPTLPESVAFIHPDDQEAVRLHLKAYAGVADPGLSVRIVRPDGELRWVTARSTTETDADGKLVARFGTLADVTEIKRTEAAAKESEERYRFLAEYAPDMIARTSLTGEIVYISPSSVRVFGYSPEEMISLNAQEMVHPDDLELVMAGIFRLIEERIERLPEPLCYRARHKDGAWIWIETNPTLIFDKITGEPVEFIDIVRNVTQTKLFEAELEEARQRAEEAAAAKSAFLANMSHELRTPLTSIIGFSQLMGEQDDLSDDTRHFAKRISDASEALLAIINDVLDFSKLDARQVALETRPLSMRRLVDEATGLIAIQAATKGVAVKTKLDARLPAQILGDVARLRQVLLNFLSNAVKFTEGGAVSVNVAYVDKGEGPRMRVEVKDTGPGISAEGVSRLFERFSQAEVSINRTHGGTGLGLAICKGIVELMGGTIGVNTKVGKGSTFWFEVPAEEASEPVEQANDELTFDCPQLRLLVVDDTPVNRELVKLMLTPMGLQIQEAAGGAEGVKAAFTEPFDLILMDVRMPGVDGLEATRMIRGSSPFNAKTPILALTADVQPENFISCRNAGMNDIIAKPISPAELISKIFRYGAPNAVQNAPEAEVA